MKVSKKAYYGLRAVLALAQAKKPISIHTLAQTEHLPEGYLEKILQSLRRADIVEARKGSRGGYSLTRTPQTINVWEILKTLDGPIKTFVPAIKGELPCFQPSHCQTNEAWRFLETEIKNSLSRVSLTSLVPKNNLKK